MSLYNKYRPQTFEDFIGNATEIKTLKNTLTKPDHPRVYLFSGPAGCGKTSMARVVADYVKATDIMEMNSADNRGIDTAREIIEATRYLTSDPVVYILDEVHKASNDFQNAMLKVLEDVPPNVYFILCSSEPAKIISAIKSRCTEIKFKSLTDDQVLSLYRRVLKAEGIRYPIQVLEALVASANGSPRTALVLLEKSIGLDEEEIITMLEQDVVAATTISICRALLAKETSWGDMAALLSSLETTDWESLRYAVLGYMTSVLLKSKNKIAAMTIECFSEPFYNSGKAGLVLACYKSIVM